MKIKELMSAELVDTNSKDWKQSKDCLEQAIEKLELLESLGELIGTWKKNPTDEIELSSRTLARLGCYLRDESFNIRNLLTEETDENFCYTDDRWEGGES